MAREKEARAPYNFVPFSETVICRYQAASELPGHDVLDPQLLSGQIHLTLTADSPVYVGNGRRDGFSKAADGRYRIPGSTLRGLIRENMQILGLGRVTPGVDFQDVHLYYRDMASGSNSVDKDRKKVYRNALAIKSYPAGTRWYAVPENVKGAYLYRKNGRCYLMPLKGEVLLVSRKAPIAAQWAGSYAFEEKIWFQESGGRVTALSQAPVAGYRCGVLMSSGYMQKQSHLYLFPEGDTAAEPIPLTEEEELSYQDDFERKRNILGKNRYHWQLPKKEGERKAVFCVRHNGFTSIGVSRFPRIGYRNPLSRGLPEIHRSAGQLLDYPNSILGFGGSRGGFRSRVWVEDLLAQADPQEMEAVSLILSGPKPTFQAGYVADGGNYNQDTFRLNGYKQYWLKDPQAADQVEKQNVASVLHPLPKGTRFSGVIRYRNLHPDELGLLLWCLRLEEGCYQSIGMGKPYGYGRMKVSIDSLLEWETQSLYSGLTAKPAACGQTQDRVEELIRTYDRYACEKIADGTLASVGELDTVQDFLYMKQRIWADTRRVSYLDLKEHRNLQAPLPTVRKLRAGTGPHPAAQIPGE